MALRGALESPNIPLNIEPLLYCISGYFSELILPRSLGTPPPLRPKKPLEKKPARGEVAIARGGSPRGRFSYSS